MTDTARFEAIHARLHHLPPMGYQVDWVAQRFVSDAKYFPLVRKLFELALAGTTVGEIARTMREDWGMYAPIHGRIGGKYVARQNVYKILANKFYAGSIVWKGVEYEGLHEAIVTREEFERVQSFRGCRTAQNAA